MRLFYQCTLILLLTALHSAGKASTPDSSKIAGIVECKTATFGGEENSSFYLPKKHFVFRLFGRSAYGINNRLVVSSCLPAFLTPNLQVNYWYYSQKPLYCNISGGSVVLLVPIAFVTGIALPGLLIGAGTVGVIHGTAFTVKHTLAVDITKRWAVALTAGISTIHLAYTGEGVFSGVGANGAGLGFMPLALKKKWYLYSGSTSVSYLLKPNRVLVWNTVLNGFEGGHRQLGWSTFKLLNSYKSLRYSIGLYSFFDPPSFAILTHSKLPVGLIGSLYFHFQPKRK